nr:MAG TPA: hypothetical protein [Caudoviricetes sp.]DAO26430.1 MAG TPA: hypothetical protein [Caudoviricetes sp.]DAT17413.1 MAG TPA: hypothetical protein [Caudoviricetes sp.]
MSRRGNIEQARWNLGDFGCCTELLRAWDR